MEGVKEARKRCRFRTVTFVSRHADGSDRSEHAVYSSWLGPSLLAPEADWRAGSLKPESRSTPGSLCSSELVFHFLLWHGQLSSSHAGPSQEVLRSPSHPAHAPSIGAWGTPCYAAVQRLAAAGMGAP